MSIKIFTISECPLDSIIGNSEQAKNARAGILEYAKQEKPDVIFVDGLCSRVKNSEAYIEGINNPLKTLFEEPFNIASEFLKELKNASPSAEVYMPLSDADEDNIGYLTKNLGLEKSAGNNTKIKDCKKNVKELAKKIKIEEKQRKRGWNKKVECFAKEIEDTQNQVKALTKKTGLPAADGQNNNALKEKASELYITKLKELNPGINIFMGNIELTVKNHSILYSHNFHEMSDTSLKSRTNRLLTYVDKLKMGGSKLPEFIIESGHHGENIAHPYRQGDSADAYSLIYTSMVMEDQRVVRDILDGKIMPERFQGKGTRLEACKRHSKKNCHLPSPGISMLERNEGGFAVTVYNLEHLAKVGLGKIKPLDINNQGDVEEIIVFSDIHVGKGAVRYEKLKSAINNLKNDIEKKVADKKSAPILLMLNESLQGRNYAHMVVETPRTVPTKFDRKLEDIIAEGKITGNGKNLDMDTVMKLKNEIIRELEKTNEPRILNQLEWYYDLTNDLVLSTLLFCKYNPAIVYTEGTHIQHTVGEFGITEAGLQSFVYKIMGSSVPYLQKIGELKNDTRLKNIDKKMLICEESSGFIKFDLELGDLTYKVSSGHKPGSANPSTNIPGKQVERATTMADDSDMHFAGHLHTSYFFSIGRFDQNSISAFYKGGTFNEYDSYGREKGWGPPIIGYVKAVVPTKKDYKGVYKAKFITSDVL